MSAPSYGTHEVLTLSRALALADACAKDPKQTNEARAKFRAVAHLIRKACK